MNTALVWFRRAGVLLALGMAGAVVAYLVDLGLGLVGFNTRVVIGVALALLSVGLMIWWAANVLDEAIQEVRSVADDIDSQRNEGRALLTYATEQLTLFREMLDLTHEMLEIADRRTSATAPTGVVAASQRSVTEVMRTTQVKSDAGRTDTVEASEVITSAVVSTPDPEVEAWARAEVAKIWGSSASPNTDPIPISKPTPAKRTTSRKPAVRKDPS